MHLLQQILFLILVAVSTWFFSKKIRFVRRNILLGKDVEMGGNSAERWKKVLLLALGQKKMFKYPLVALMHLIIYAGFVIINLEVLEIVLDGILGTHRLFLPALGPLYSWLINSFEVLAAGVLLVCVVFLVRRNILKLKRFMKHELDGWPRTDANLILVIEIMLMSLFLTMNAADTALQLQGYAGYHETGSFVVSGALASMFQNTAATTLVALERACWWLHIIGIFAFLNYLPYSKHLHILLAFPNTYYTRLQPQGKVNNMPEIQNEVLYAMQPELAPTTPSDTPMHFGAKDATDLTWKNLLDAYTCTECGRCTAACPANITGKLLNPRKIMMDTRDRVDEIGKNMDANGSFKDDGKTLLHDYITAEELWACTTCQACVEECPVSISPLEIIVSLRRHLIMEESSAPAEWNATFSNIENNFAPWKFSPDDRDKWAVEMQD